MVGGRRDRRLNGGGNVSGAMTVCRRDRGLYGGRNVSGAMMWLEVGETEDSMVEAMCNAPECGWR